jgi:hypothetical protein
LIYINIGQNVDPSIATKEPMTKDNTTAKLASPTIEDMIEVPGIIVDGPTAKGGTAAKLATIATPTINYMSKVPSVTTNNPTAKGGTTEKLATEAAFKFKVYSQSPSHFLYCRYSHLDR